MNACTNSLLLLALPYYCLQFDARFFSSYVWYDVLRYDMVWMERFLNA